MKNQEIEITPEMVEAGVRALALFDGEDRLKQVVRTVFRAMLDASQETYARHR